MRQPQWNKLVDQLFDLDRDNPFFGQTVEHVQIMDFNPYHEPAGSPEGGQFAEAPGLFSKGKNLYEEHDVSDEFKKEMLGFLEENATWNKLDNGDINRIVFWDTNKNQDIPGAHLNPWQQQNSMAWWNPMNKTLNFPERELKPFDSATKAFVVEHELGHVLDQSKLYSSFGNYQQAFKSDVKKMNKGLRENQLAYFADYPKEAFAEAHAYVKLRNAGKMEARRAIFEKSFPEVINFVKTTFGAS